MKSQSMITTDKVCHYDNETQVITAPLMWHVCDCKWLFPIDKNNSKIKISWKIIFAPIMCHLYGVFTYIYSLLIKKNICGCQNVLIKLPRVCVCLFSGNLFILCKSFLFLFLFFEETSLLFIGKSYPIFYFFFHKTDPGHFFIRETAQIRQTLEKEMVKVLRWRGNLTETLNAVILKELLFSKTQMHASLYLLTEHIISNKHVAKTLQSTYITFECKPDLINLDFHLNIKKVRFPNFNKTSMFS